MSLQAQPKSSSKRTGKRIAFLSEQGVPGKEAQQQQQQQQQLKESQYYGHGGNVPSSQAMELSKFSGVASNAALLNSLYAQARGEPRMTPQHLAAAKWQNSPIGSRLPERSEASWQPQPGGWNHGMPYGGSQKVGHPNIGVAGFYSHPDTLKRNREKGVVVSQLDLYVDDVQQMMSQKVQLEQQALARQQAQINSFQQLQKQQQQQPQNQTLPLQPFQLAFGHQGQKQGLPELLHVFQQAPVSSSPAFTAQQKPQALPQLQLFENFYPQQQQQQQHHHHQQQAAVQAFGIQQPVSVAQPHMAEPSQPSQHHMASHQFHPVPERNQELLKALTEQNSQTVLPQAQIPLPRRSRRLSKEGVLPVSSAEEALESKPAEEYPGNVLPHHWQAQQHPEVQFRHPPETFGHNKESYSQQNRVESGPGEGPAGGQSNQAEMEKVRAYENAREGIKHMPVTDGLMQRANDFGVRGGVIQSTRRRRRISQEANLLTLAQKAVELASLLDVKEPETSEEKNKSDMAATAPRSVVEFAGSSPAPKRTREDSNLMPLIIPVSVPVMRLDPQDVGRDNGEDGKLQRFISNDRGLSESKPSVIVTRRRSNRNLNMDMLAQHESAAPKEEMEGFSRKPKQRPRPEPLFIPPKAGTFIAPPVYSNITPYQSHLRSPVRLADHPSDRNFELPPYTPPPILSPVREGSGLYFNAILSASGSSVPPPITPKRTLLRSNSAEVTPPVLSVMGEATPVSIEPRINVGTRFQAEIPPLRDRSLAASDKAKAELVWQPWDRLETDTSTQEHVENLVTAACSSIFPGGGTNQELAYHCLHEAKGNILTALTKLLLKKSVRLSNHPLANYHYTGSDKWSALEKKLFNKGLAIYKKDFFLVQKLIKTKTVAQCVEFYYTFKKQVKIGRNGTLIFGDADAASERAFKDEAEVDIKSSHRLTRTLPPRTYNEDYENTDDEEEEEAEEELTVKKEAIEKEELQDKHSSTALPKPTQNLHSENPAGSLLPEKHQEPSAPRGTEARGRASKRTKEMPIKYRKSSPPAQKRRRKPKPKPDTTNKTQNQEEEFPCKKCGRIFYKVKSRSAHMKSHAEQEKKAAALKQREKEEAEAEAARSRAQREESRDTGSTSGSSSSSSDDDVDV